MSTPKITKVTVDSKESMESSIAQYVAQGYTVVNKSEKRTTLQKPKKFNIAIGIVGFLVCVIGLIIYAIIYANQPDAEVIDIVVE
jgi:hypothetical protein